jgi:hypothetical protein
MDKCCWCIWCICRCWVVICENHYFQAFLHNRNEGFNFISIFFNQILVCLMLGIIVESWLESTRSCIGNLNYRGSCPPKNHDIEFMSSMEIGQWWPLIVWFLSDLHFVLVLKFKVISCIHEVELLSSSQSIEQWTRLYLIYFREVWGNIITQILRING